MSGGIYVAMVDNRADGQHLTIADKSADPMTNWISSDLAEPLGEMR